jgi:hypothetical protein
LKSCNMEQKLTINVSGTDARSPRKVSSYCQIWRFHLQVNGGAQR